MRVESVIQIFYAFHYFWLVVLPPVKKVVLKSPAVIVNFSIFLFNSVIFFDALLSGKYTSVTVTSSQWIDSFIVTKSPSLSLLLLCPEVGYTGC